MKMKDKVRLRISKQRIDWFK